MSRKPLLPLIALFLLGADGPEDSATPPDGDIDTVGDGDTTAPQAPLAVPAQPDAATPGETALQTATAHLSAREWSEALDIAIVSIARYPELAASFQAIATLATDQIARGPVFSAPGGSDRPLAVTADGQPQNPANPDDPYGSWRTPNWRSERPHPAANDPRKGILIGFDAGLNNGLRVEWKAKGRTIDGVGLQAGFGTWIYGGVFLAPMTQVYMDFQSRSDFQFETSIGLLWASGSAYPLIGIGAQWDPPRPIQINAGVDVGVGIFPDVSIGFLW